MQRHGRSLLESMPQNYDIHIVGFVESAISASLRNNQRIKVHNITSLRFHHLPFPLYAFLKLSSEFLSLYWLLLLSPSIQSPLTHIFVQNPPSIPIVSIAKFSSIIRRSILLIDWHNFGFSILALKQKNLFVDVYKFIERSIGKMADIHLTVSEAMKACLIEEWRFESERVFVLYDRPTLSFLNATKNESDDALLWSEIEKYFAFKHESVCSAKGRSLWLISSTSWTMDEDLNLLMDDAVMQRIDNLIKEQNQKIVLFVTGKDEGNLRKAFVEKCERLRLKNVQIIPLWLESHKNYIQLLKWCDVGLCFHASSSGLDLPMKVVDMFGVGMPVIAINFNRSKMIKMMKISEANEDKIKTALNELVRHNENGFVFDSSEQLIGYILELYKNENNQMEKFRKNIEKFREHKWENEWKKVMKKTKVFGTDL